MSPGPDHKPRAKILWMNGADALAAQDTNRIAPLGFAEEMPA
jgi:hypothetical protein